MCPEELEETRFESGFEREIVACLVDEKASGNILTIDTAKNTLPSISQI